MGERLVQPMEGKGILYTLSKRRPIMKVGRCESTDTWSKKEDEGREREGEYCTRGRNNNSEQMQRSN